MGDGQLGDLQGQAIETATVARPPAVPVSGASVNRIFDVMIFVNNRAIVSRHTNASCSSRINDVVDDV